MRPKLHHAAVADGSCDVTKIGVDRSGAGVAELRRIGQTEGLPAQLQTPPFAQGDVLEVSPGPLVALRPMLPKARLRWRRETRGRKPGAIEADAMQDLERRHQVGRL